MKFRHAGLLALACMAGAPGGAAPRPADDLQVDRVVVMMRHGIRSPTKAPALPLAITPESWPEWPVRPGWLTPHGAQAVGALGTYDRAGFVEAGLLPKAGCPRVGAVAVIADSDQRTIATAENWVRTLAPGCSIAIEHKPQDVTDPQFSVIDEGVAAVDPARADADVKAAIGPGGIAALEASQRALLRRLDVILCGKHPAPCGVSSEASGVVPAKSGARPKLSGALDRASTAAQILLLEYADGKPVADIGWGRASAADVTALSEFHALEFRVLARPRYLASLNMTLLAPRIVKALSSDAADAPAVTMISGHDTNVANLGGLLDVHWRVPGIAQDDPVPGGAILLERLRDAQGNFYVRAVYRAQTLAQLRTASGAGLYRATLPIKGCRARGVEGLCTLDQFRKLMAAN